MVAILLATYNSGNYIREQLDSIFSQTYQQWTIYVHDDGSKDNTIQIIDSYIKKHPRKIQYISNLTTGLRACKSFIALQEEVIEEYYMFCDHDDVWLPNKIEISLAHMKVCEYANPNLPVVVHTDMKVVDVNLNIIHESFWAYMRLLPEHCKFVELVACHCVNGCTILFNRKANEIALANRDYAIMHDVLLSESVAANDGIISAIHEPTVLYRQHGSNVLGAHEMNRFMFIKKFINVVVFFKTNYNLWVYANKIKKIRLAKFIYVKLYLTILRLYEYK